MINEHNSNGDIMEENNEFLLYLYKITDMGITSMKTLVDIIKDKDNKIINLLYEELNEYKDSLEKVKAIMKTRDLKKPSDEILRDLGVSANMHMELMKDNSDARIAEMLINGYTMGIIELKKNIEKYESNITPEERKIAEEISKYQNKNLKKLKKYL